MWQLDQDQLDGLDSITSTGLNLAITIAVGNLNADG